MAVNTQFSIAVHIMAALAYRCDSRDLTSGDLANSVNTSPSFVRRVVARLSKAGLLETTTGKAGAYSEQKGCTVSCHIKKALENALEKTQNAMEAGLADISLKSIVTDMKKA
jgi:DNA-binding IscR family transcriptional regulator